MKKILLSAAFVCVSSLITTAQTRISQTGGASATAGTVACPATPTGMSANAYFRAYTMSTAMDIGSLKIGVGSTTGNIPITVKLHKSNSAFPASYPAGLTSLGSTTVTVAPSTADAQGNPIAKTIDVVFSSPISVASGDIIVAEVSHGATTSQTFYMGVVSGSETAPAYIMAANCGAALPVTITSIAPANTNAKIVIDLIKHDPASSEQFFSENFTLYPNPTTDVLNISSKNGLNANEVRITDMTGKVVRIQKEATTINVSDLAAGTYLIDITTKEGKATSKFIKK